MWNIIILYEDPRTHLTIKKLKEYNVKLPEWFHQSAIYHTTTEWDIYTYHPYNITGEAEI